MSDPVRWLIVGAGPQGRVVLESLQAAEPQAEVGFVDDNPDFAGKQILGAAVAGPLSLLEQHDGPVIFAIGNNLVRLRLAAAWEHLPGFWGKVVHPSAVISPSATLGPGTAVLPQAVVHTGATVGAHVIVNTGAVVEHDCVLEDGCSISPGARMSGCVQIGRAAFVSSGATLAPGVRIGARAIVAAGAVVAEDVPAHQLVMGVPARIVREVDDDRDWRRAAGG